ncbi:MAG: GDP-mannose 4,6-dehydratase [bacterium]|nr:GDP-mannose 4,6-dehydratase [bacterium]
MTERSVIITGGLGFVGRHLIRELQSQASFSRIIILDRSIENLPLGVEGHAVDITNSETYADILRDTKPDWIIHLAAVSSVGFSLSHEDITRTVNVFATEELIKQTIVLVPTVKFLVISSADIYGVARSAPIVELPLSEANPTNPYGKSKLEMEQIIERDYNSYCIRARPFPHIGPGQNTGFVTADFASQIVAIENGKQPAEILVGNLDAKRDFTDVRDVVRAYRLLIEKGELGEVYHVASSRAYSIQFILDSLIALSSSEIHIKHDESRMRPSDTPVLIGDIQKIIAATGWKPEISLETSLKDILEDWRSRV